MMKLNPRFNLNRNQLIFFSLSKIYLLYKLFHFNLLGQISRKIGYNNLFQTKIYDSANSKIESTL